MSVIIEEGSDMGYLEDVLFYESTSYGENGWQFITEDPYGRFGPPPIGPISL